MILSLIRFATASLWILCTLLLLLPHPWALFGGTDLAHEYGIGYNHLIMFATLGLFTELSRRNDPNGTAFLSLHLVCIFGASTEILQWFIPHRHFDLLDICLDFAGAYLGVSSGVLLKHFFYENYGNCENYDSRKNYDNCKNYGNCKNYDNCKDCNN